MIDVIWARNLLRPEDFGGSRYHWEVTRRLAERGNSVRVVVPRPRGPYPGSTAAELRYYRVSRSHPALTFATNTLLSQPAIRTELHRGVPDAIVLSSYDVAYGHYVFSAGRIDVPSIFIYHSSFYSDAVDRLGASPARTLVASFMRSVERRIFRSADLLIAVSPFSRAEMETRLGATDHRIRLVPTGVDTDRFTPGDRLEARERLGLPLGARILVTAGRLVPVKRYDRAIDAVARLHQKDDRYMLVMAGAGPAEAQLRARAESLGGAVRMIGFADNERLRDLYRAADLVLCTSDFENWSVAILEAFSSGTAVVGTPRGSIPDLLSIVDGDLVLADVDPNTLAAKVEALFASGRLPELGRHGRTAITQRFGWDRTADAITACVREVAGR